MGVKGRWTLLNPVESVSLVDWSAQKITTGTWMDVCHKVPSWADKESSTGFAIQATGMPFSSPSHTFIHVQWSRIWFSVLGGEAEAELAMLSDLGQIDAVMSEDFDTMVFSAQRVVRIKEESDSEYLIEEHEVRSQFSHNNLVMIALLAGGDYNVSIGEQLFDAFKASGIDNYAAVASMWCQDLCTMLEKQGAGHLHSQHHSLASHIPLDFPKVSVLLQYIHPVMSQSNGLENLPAAPSLCQPNIPLLAKLCEELFVWGHSAGIIQNFSNHVFPGLATRELLQDLYKRWGLMHADDTSISQHTMISKAILTQITSAINGIYDTDITSKKLDQFAKKREVHIWLSCVLALHARPNILDHQMLKTGGKHKALKPHIEQVRCHNIELEPSLVQPVASTSANVLNASQDSAELNRSVSVLEISSDESGKEMTGRAPIVNTFSLSRSDSKEVPETRRISQVSD
ncbi:uncharacterized protein EV420DRAFT_1485946 [Desarmillaria tabescens]|uniref:XPG-I domain-containing protein n=1 Tax=Armillaria tabescens TaxID=1929756 RepID=A0AA39JD88_ARMTA|nr:uncharacterized protein EV420DRAFT_1485946 [Desarmillaria tabescens]KAK0440483.1 hypothetical protein EV420DRAFT_1485946 [Desarmillaria tabescens]